jgi:membrane protease YdiL (CAAX protease family)
MTEISPSDNKVFECIKQLLVLVGIFFASSIVGQLIILPLASGFGMANFEEVLAEIIKGKYPQMVNPLRILLSISHAFTFLLPALAFALLYWRGNMRQSLHLNMPPKISYWAMALLFLVAILPFTAISHYLNTLIPESLHHQGGQELQQTILQMHSPIDLAFNILLVGVMAGVGEELLFRGVLQRIFAFSFRNIHLAVWLTAILFSLVHLELQAFVPRVLLGAVFGYLYYWSGSLLVPIILHFLYNSVQVVAVYSSPQMINEKAVAPEMTTYIIAAVGLVVFFFVARWFAANQSEAQRNAYFQNPKTE